MPEINYRELKKYLKTKKEFSPIYLIYGEEILYKTAFNEILDALLPVSERSMNYEPIDNDNLYEAIERVNTFSLLAGTKVVALCDSRIFYSKQDEGNILEKVKAAYDEKKIKKAAKYLRSLLNVLNLTFDDVSNTSYREKNLKLDMDTFGDDKWLDEIIQYCMDNNLPISASGDNTKDLQKAVEKGFPEGNHLIITTDIVDKRRGVFNAIKKEGMIIDCSIPKGNRMADKKEQEAVINDRMKTILDQSGKKMERSAYTALYEMTGFDLRTFSNNLEKLVAYVGDRQNITVADIESVLKRTKQDPIYELTNAITDRNIDNALFYLNSLLSAGYFPLQILAAIINQTRKLLLVKGFTESLQGKVWNPKASYQVFQTQVMPAIQQYDKMLLEQLEKWDELFSKDESITDNQKKKKGKKKKKAVTDILIAHNPNNPYPVYQILLKSEKFRKAELLDAIEFLSESDLRLKSTGQNPKLILERALFHICRGGTSFK